MGLREIGEGLPPGFRFYPTDEELVCHYLYQKILHPQSSSNILLQIDLHICEPWQLPEVAKLNRSEWYFFSFRDRKYATGYRTNRATTSGYWKATGKDRTIMEPVTGTIVGMRKTLVFYRNRAPNGIKTSWIMHEFRLQNPLLPPQEDWVLCRVFQKPKSESNSGELSPTLCSIPSAVSPPPPPPTLAISPPLDYTFDGGYHHHISSFPDSPPPQESQEYDIMSNFNDGTNDLYSRLLFDMNLGLVSEGTGVPEEMQFDGIDDDGSMIFI